MVFAFSDKDSHLGTPAVLVSLLEMLFPQIRAGTPPPRSGLCWNVTYLATSCPCPPVGNGILPPPVGHVCPSPQSHCPWDPCTLQSASGPKTWAPPKLASVTFARHCPPLPGVAGAERGPSGGDKKRMGVAPAVQTRKGPPSRVWGPSSMLCPESGVLLASHARIHRWFCPKGEALRITDSATWGHCPERQGCGIVFRPTWSWCVVLLMCYWSWCASILLRTSAFTLIRDIDL